MKEKVWIFVSVEFKEELSDWESYYSYESENEHGEKVATFCMITDSQDYKNFVDFLLKKIFIVMYLGGNIHLRKRIWKTLKFWDFRQQKPRIRIFQDIQVLDVANVV